MKEGSGTGDPDYIEVHIFDGLHRLAIERVVGPEPKSRSEKQIFKSVGRALKKVGVALEVA